MRTANEIMDEFFGKRDALEKALFELAEKAKVLRDQQDRCNASRANVEALRAAIEELQQERRGLKAGYSEALFEGDASSQQKIVRRRTAIDKDIGEKRKEIERLEASMEEDGPDMNEHGEASGTLNALRNPIAYDFCEELKRTLGDEELAIRQRIHDVGSMLSSVTVDRILNDRKKNGGASVQQREASDPPPQYEPDANDTTTSNIRSNRVGSGGRRQERRSYVDVNADNENAV